MSTENTPKVSLVGAGPGSADLITIRGLKAIQQADVVLYDALISKELLTEIDSSIPKIYVGKRCNKHSYTQTEINKLIVHNAFKYGHVVRLKGGDPFVFGRASEEIDYAESFGLPVTIIPGVSSVIAVPSSQGIPITKRGYSSSFWVLTATKKDGSFSEDLHLASKSSATLILLMGIRKLTQISEFIARNRDHNTPIAVIQNGTLKNESCIVSTLCQIKEEAFLIDKTQPGIIIIGDVVADHPSFYKDEVMRVLHSTI